ncbi:uncharacterized protein LOC141896866 isoform X2 [Acropora palmata]|uniref:uncharacterized protein LOC141896866 isoform X2 n=1 Tax=Acropora palmata TaxID=6131 RepID=UPI003DA16F30
MAENFIHGEEMCYSDVLKILEAEYEKSKLRVFQDTLLCKRSIVEVELLFKEEVIRKNNRVKKKIRQHEFELQEQLTSLSSELKNATAQLQTAQNALEEERALHDLEKERLEERFREEMEKKMEEQINVAFQRENSLQEKINDWQEKHRETLKQAEDLRMELRKKNVVVKTKAIQACVRVEHASTMAQVDSLTVDAETQVEQLTSLADTCNRTNKEGVRRIDEVNQETSVSGEEKKISECTCEANFTEQVDVRDALALIAESSTSLKEISKEDLPRGEELACAEEPNKGQLEKNDERGAETAGQNEEDKEMKITELSQLQNKGQLLCQDLTGDDKIAELKSNGIFSKWQETSKGTEKAERKKRKVNENLENVKMKKRKELKPTVEEVSPGKTLVGKERIEAESGRVLRSRMKKSQDNHRLILLDSDESTETGKSKTDEMSRRGREPVMLLNSSPRDHKIANKTELSSSETDTPVDQRTPLKEVANRTTQSLAETEMHRSELVTDYNAGQERWAFDTNRMRLGKAIMNECLHRGLEETSAGISPAEDKNAKCVEPETMKNRRANFCQNKHSKGKQGRRKEEENVVYDSGLQDYGAVKPNVNHLSSKSHEAKKRTKKQVILEERTDEALKENTDSDKRRAKKRKPTRSVRQKLASADQQPSTNGKTNTSSISDKTKKRKTLFNSRENSLVVSSTKDQISFENTKVSKDDNNSDIPPSLSAFLRSFIAPKLKKSF